MPTVTALRQFTYKASTVKRGDPVDMDPTDALVHARKGNVSLSRQVQTRTVVAEPPSEAHESPPRRRRYRRRDMQAEG